MKLEEIILRGLRSAQPSVSSVPKGTIYFVTDESKLERNSGSAWQDISSAGALSSHHTTHENGGTDEISVAGLSGLLGDAQTPLGHHASHESGGSDAIKLDDLSAPDDNTDLDASTTKHGLMKKFPGGTTNFLREDGSFAAPSGGGVTLVPSVLIATNTSYVSFSTITLGAASSLVGWFYFTGGSLANYSPIWEQNSQNEMYYGDGGSSGKFAIIKSNSIIFRSTSNLPAINSGWHFLVITDNGSAVKAYVDAVDIGNSIGSYTSLNGMALTRLNQGSNANNYFGYISECAIFSRALSSGEVTTLYNSGAGVYGDPANAPFNSGLVAGWHLSEGGISIVPDFSGNGHDATLNYPSGNGAALWAPLQNIITPP